MKPILLTNEKEVLEGGGIVRAFRDRGLKIIEAYIGTGAELDSLRGRPITEGKEGKPTLWMHKCDELRIEGRENIHIHWNGAAGERLVVGRRDFMILAEAFEKLEL